MPSLQCAAADRWATAAAAGAAWVAMVPAEVIATVNAAVLQDYPGWQPEGDKGKQEAGGGGDGGGGWDSGDGGDGGGDGD
jgi:hypothetical protein